jgi:putative hemolysin
MPPTAVRLHGCRNPLATTERFSVGLAQTLEDVIGCQRLRYLIFNCELGEGLDSSARSGLDRDQFDFICDHLMVHDTATGKLVRTYRMQSGCRVKGDLGYYGEGLFEFGPFEAIRGEVVARQFAASPWRSGRRGYFARTWKFPRNSADRPLGAGSSKRLISSR